MNPEADIEVIQTELMLADLQTVEKSEAREAKLGRTGNKEAKQKAELYGKVKAHLESGKPARTYETEEEEKELLKPLCLLTQKPVLYVCNTTGSDEEQSLVEQVKKIADFEGARMVTIDCSLESEIAELDESEKSDYLKEMGLEESGLNRLIREAFQLLGLCTYYTAGPKEVRAWTIKNGFTAPQAAGVIHSDFERGFICAECFSSADLIEHRSEKKLKELGKIRQEGKEYIVQPGDVMFFKFNV